MTKKNDTTRSLHAWTTHLASPDFEQRLRALVAAQLDQFAAMPLDQLVAAADIHDALEHADPAALDREVLVDAILAGRRRLAAQLSERKGTLADTLGDDAIADVDRFFDELRDLPPYVEELIAGILEQEFVERMLTDLIFTAIDGFYRKVNPLFGGLTTRMLEDQIKGFIRLFMPTLQQQAIAFATSRANHRAVVGLARSIVDQVLDEPAARFGKLLAAGDDATLAKTLRARMRPPKLGGPAHAILRGVLDDLYRRHRHRPVREILDLSAHHAWLAQQITDRLVTLLRVPEVLGFIASEAEEVLRSPTNAPAERAPRKRAKAPKSS